MEKLHPMLILASKSAARKALLAGAGLEFESCPAEIDERAQETDAAAGALVPAAVACRLAEAKARAVAGVHRAATVIGADQLLEFEGAFLHKPLDRDAARAQLQRLRGRTHHLLSGVALVRDDQVLWSHCSTSSLTMRDFSDLELEDVLEREGDAALGSVGGYRLEGPSLRLFESIDGDYFSILGLPMLPLLAALRQHAPHLL